MDDVRFTVDGIRWELVTTAPDLIGYDTVYHTTIGQVTHQLKGKWVPGCSSGERVFWLHTNDHDAEPLWLGGPCLPSVAVVRATRVITDPAEWSRV